FSFPGKKSHQFDGNNDKDVSIGVDSWQWKVGDTTASQSITRSGVHTNYCVLAVPAAPWYWYNDEKTHPWVSALEIVCNPAPWAGGTTDKGSAWTRITGAINGATNASGAFVFTYVSGAKYLNPAPAPNTVYFTSCIDLLNGGSGRGPEVNCLDCADFVVTFGNLVARKLAIRDVTPISQQGIACNAIILIGSSNWTSNKYWSVHCVAAQNNPPGEPAVYDACLKVDDGPDNDPRYEPRGPKLPTGLPFADSTTNEPPYAYDEYLAMPFYLGISAPVIFPIE
ncbi:MAG: hypothetical protein WCL44_15200, partial [bacterium]